MAGERARQKKLEKHRKARAAAQKKARAPALPTSRAALERAAERWPVTEAYLAGDLADEERVALVASILVRDCPDGRFLATLALVDRTCLGVKDAMTMQPMTRDELDGALERLEEAHEVLTEVSPDVARSVVFHALDYAASLGFAPHRDFPAALFGPRPAVLVETPLCRPTRPFYCVGPHDDVDAIVAKLERAVGTGGFDMVDPDGATSDGLEDDDEDERDDGEDERDDDDDDDDDDNELEGAAAQLKRFAQPLILATDGSRESIQRIFGLASFFWNLALESDPLRSKPLEAELARLPDDAARAKFRDVARTMVERHRVMFPELHRPPK